MRPAQFSTRSLLSRPWGLPAEAAFVGLVLLAWQLLRIPLEGDIGTSLAHARTELHIEQALHVDIERAVMHALDRPLLTDAMGWFYVNAHVPVLVGFLVLARLAAPARYPLLRLTFALSFVPAAFVIGLFPVAPPRFLPELGGTPPSNAELTSTTDQLVHNATAAAVSHHFGLALFIAVGALWLWPRSRLAWVAALYPVAVFVVILATANHYVLDCVAGAAVLGIGALAARLFVVEPEEAWAAEEAPAPAAALAVGYALLAWSLESISGLSSRPAVALALFAGTVLAFGVPAAVRTATAGS